MNAKYWLLIAVVSGLFAWAVVETQRLFVARQQLAASVQLQKDTSQQVAIAQLKHSNALAGKK